MTITKRPKNYRVYYSFSSNYPLLAPTTTAPRKSLYPRALENPIIKGLLESSYRVNSTESNLLLSTSQDKSSSSYHEPEYAQEYTDELDTRDDESNKILKSKLTIHAEKRASRPEFRLRDFRASRESRFQARMQLPQAPRIQCSPRGSARRSAELPRIRFTVVLCMLVSNKSR